MDGVAHPLPSEDTPRLHMRRKPFFPFVVELTDGSVIEIDYPSIAFGGGRATFIPEKEELVDFYCDETVAIRAGVAEVAK